MILKQNSWSINKTCMVLTQIGIRQLILALTVLIIFHSSLLINGILTTQLFH